MNVPDRSASPDAYLSLDQGMIMAALGNALGDDVLRARVRRTARWSARCAPVIGIERFNDAGAP